MRSHFLFNYFSINFKGELGTKHNYNTSFFCKKHQVEAPSVTIVEWIVCLNDPRN